ncbi:ribbon-helix-helix domain-containing protein [Sessilibacter corallicola]|uniref:Ribbon-helix-helix domain-containing protein n=1 Tax=Sessilibacter corallicola TaxID=2904075 RepID=A0ABQ0ACJ8_9GAMM|nr:ribbon-helix-helix domain-containing protein [Sessilibacter corallicola]MCE2029768.1 ribbon-helix-helix domain-containing protein [Sessilibacter corallicola]
MCKLFIEADSQLWKPNTRSIRIDGVVTSIRLEHFFWNMLEEIADRDDLSVGQLITRLYLEAMDADHDLGNFTSFLRVCCSRYLSLIADGQLERDARLPLATLDGKSMIEFEAENSKARHTEIDKRRRPTH